jgi:hypothetical protein
VELSSEAAVTTPQQRERMAAQIAWTLQGVPGVESVALRSGGKPLPLPNAPDGIVRVSSFAYLDAAAVPGGAALHAIVDDRVAAVDVEAGSDSVPGPFGGEVSSRSVGVDASGTMVATVTTDGATLVVGGLSTEATARAVLTGTDLAPPSWDRFDTVWLADRRGRESRVLTVVGDEVYDVDAGPLADGRVRELRVSPDGVRVAALVDAGQGRTRLLVGVVGTRGTTPSLVGFQPLRPQDAQPLDLAWGGAASLVGLRDPAGAAPPAPFSVDLSDGTFALRGELPGAISLAAGPGQTLVLGLEDGTLVRQDPLLEWSPLGSGRDPAYPG